jgi:hypothetical protein
MKPVCWLRTALTALAVAGIVGSLLACASETTVMAEVSARGHHGGGPGGTVGWVLVGVSIISLIIYRFVTRGRRR